MSSGRKDYMMKLSRSEIPGDIWVVKSLFWSSRHPKNASLLTSTEGAIPPQFTPLQCTFWAPTGSPAGSRRKAKWGIWGTSGKMHTDTSHSDASAQMCALTSTSVPMRETELTASWAPGSSNRPLPPAGVQAKNMESLQG